jgi:hypothetical protein
MVSTEGHDVMRGVQRLPWTAWVASALPVVALAFGSTFSP